MTYFLQQGHAIYTSKQVHQQGTTYSNAWASEGTFLIQVTPWNLLNVLRV